MNIEIDYQGTPRASLAEGRNRGFGSTLLKKIDDAHYETLMGLTACKDFLHDVFVAEEFNEKVSVHGLKYSKTNVFDAPNGYFLISILDCKHGAWPQYKKEIDRLKNNFKNLETFINGLEEYLNVDGRSEIAPLQEDNLYFIKSPKKWVESPYLLSLYTLMLRIGYYYEAQQNPMDYVKSLLGDAYIEGDFGEDVGLLRQIYHKIEYIHENGFPKENLQKRKTAVGTSYGWHNAGIVKVEFSGENKSSWME